MIYLKCNFLCIYSPWGWPYFPGCSECGYVLIKIGKFKSGYNLMFRLEFCIIKKNQLVNGAIKL